MFLKYITLLIFIKKKKIVAMHAGSSNLTYVETNQVSLKYVTESICYLRKINKMQAGNYTKMKDCAVLNYLLYIVFPTPPFLHHITAPVIITHK